MRYAIVIVLSLAGGCGGAVEHPEIRAVLDKQVAAWNQGDIEVFMAHYWKSDELTFISTSKKNNPTTRAADEVTVTTHGWEATLERYTQRYPTREKMGTLRFNLGKIARTGEDTAEVAGRFHLDFADGGEASGRFYLHMRQIDAAWVIVRDFTVGD